MYSQAHKNINKILLATVLSIACILAALSHPPTAYAAGQCYVNANAGGGGTGVDWANAYTDLQSALGDSSCTEIWVTAGTYTPDGASPGDRTLSFQLQNGLAIYGGFAGTETQRNQRDPATNVTILSGDIGTTVPNYSYHVVTGSGTDNTAILDGFTITQGYASDVNSDTDVSLNSGGGMYNVSGSPTLRNLIFDHNTAYLYGGGIYNYQSSPSLSNVAFTYNQASFGGGVYDTHGGDPIMTNLRFYGNSGTGSGGGGMHIEGSSVVLTDANFDTNNAVAYGGGMYAASGFITLTNVSFTNNDAGKGGGMYSTNTNSLILQGVTFSNNTALDGGGMYNDGDVSPTNLTLTNGTFSGNHACNCQIGVQNYGFGGGMYNNFSSPGMINVTFSGNAADSIGGGIYNDGGIDDYAKPVLVNVILWNDSASLGSPEIANAYGHPYISYSVVQGGCNSTPGAICDSGNLDTDPKLAALADNGGSTQTMGLLSGSSAIDTGDDASCPVTDQRGVTRPQGAHCDIGAFESELPTNTPPDISAGGPYSGNEGAPISMSGANALDPDGDTLTYHWSVDSSLCGFDDVSLLTPNLTCSDNGSFTVSLTVNDGVTPSVSSDTTVMVNNVSPTASLGNDGPIDEGRSATISFTGALDPSSEDISSGLHYAFDCNGGSLSAATYADGGTSDLTSCPFADNGSYIVSGKIMDKDGGANEYATSVTVDNVAPTLGAINVDQVLVPTNTVINTSADFNDPGVFDTHMATWEWGDSITSPGTVSETDGSGTTSGSHSYSEPGIYTVSLTVTDKDSAASNLSTYQNIVVYDPTGGYVTGKGWIVSQAGWCQLDDACSAVGGKATFAFVSKYKKGTNVPIGKTDFNFQAGGLDFHSESYDWLIVNQGDSNAQFKGEGTINGSLDSNGDLYKFMLWAGDGSPDTFHIKIWWEDADGTEHVIYDNSTDQAIDGGHIIVHK